MILVNLSKRDTVSSSDIQKVLSIPNTSSTQKLKELAIGGKLYFQVNTSFIYLSNHNHTHFQSFFDRNSDGGVYVEDVTDINISPHRHVNI